MLRIIHAWVALTVLLLLLSSQAAQWLGFTPEAAALWRIHAWIGYGLLLGLVARLSWALYGPKHANWRQLWTWRAWLGALRERAFFVAPARFGHHPLATAAYLAFYAAALVMAVSGLALAAIDQGQGPLYHWLGHDMAWKAWFRAPHDLLEEFLLAYVIAHVAALILHEARHGVPMAQAMVSGYQYRRDDAE
ncbi:MAG: cytochrome b/b6 domain-containing protein [Pseudomonadota bacterium]